MVLKHDSKTAAFSRPVLTRDIQILAVEHTPEVMYGTMLDSLDPASWCVI